MVLIDNTTLAKTSVEFTVNSRYRLPPNLKASGLAGAETVDLYQYVNGNWLLVKVGGSTVQATATNNTFPIDSVGKYRVYKGVTAGAVSVTLDEESAT